MVLASNDASSGDRGGVELTQASGVEIIRTVNEFTSIGFRQSRVGIANIVYGGSAGMDTMAALRLRSL